MTKPSLFHQVLISDSTEPLQPPNQENIKEYFPNHTHIVWDRKNITKLMLKNGDKEVAEAFGKVKPYSYKSDLARHYIVYHYGGWYADLNNFFIAEPPDVSDVDIVVFRDIGGGTEVGTWSIQTALFFAKPRNPISKSTVEKCVNNIQKDYYGPHPLYPTGPPVFGMAAAEGNALIQQNAIIGNYFWHEDSSKRGYYFGNFGDQKKFALYKPNMKVLRSSPIAGGNDYGSMWYEHEVY
jgi:mannosyltransferase OCH1-like enzyme